MCLRRIEYDEVIRLSKEANPKLGEAIEKFISLQQNKEYYYGYLLEYRYGELILGHDGINLPINSTENTPETLRQFEKDIEKYPGRIPLSLITDKYVEVYLERNGIAKSLANFQSGEFIGTYEARNLMSSEDGCPQPSSERFKAPWQATAGSRSVHLPMLAGAGEARVNIDDLLIRLGLSDLSVYEQSLSLSENFFPVARDIINSTDLGANWNVRLIVFPSKWVKHTNSSELCSFHQYINNIAWEQSVVSRKEQALISELSVFFRGSPGSQEYNYCIQVLVDLVWIGLGLKPSHLIVSKNSVHDQSLLLQLANFLGSKLDYLKGNSPIIIQSTQTIKQDLQEFEKIEFLYSATSMGQPLSTVGLGKYHINLTKMLFKQMSHLFQNTRLIDFFEEIYGCKVQFELYGNPGTKRECSDVREIFNMSEVEQRKRKIDCNNPFLLGCVKIKLTRRE